MSSKEEAELAIAEIEKNEGNKAEEKGESENANITSIPEAPETTKDVMKAMKTIEKGGGKGFMRTSIETFRSADGKSKSSDVYATGIEEGLITLKEMVKKCKESEESSKKKKVKEGAIRWKFESVPLVEFEKTLDDLFLAFLRWSLVETQTVTISKDSTTDTSTITAETKESESEEVKDGEDADDESDKSGMFNVSKAFRRLESYADWMESSKEDLMVPKFSAKEIKDAWDLWSMHFSKDCEGRLVWWLDFAAIDLQGVKKIEVSDTFRFFVWVAHFVLFNEAAQKYGVVFVENCSKVGMKTTFTIVPPKVGLKLDRLTIGVLPVKMKALYLLETAFWMNVIMALMSPFLSKKMKSRLINLKNDYSKLTEKLGGNEYVLKGFGSANGTLTEDLGEAFIKQKLEQQQQKE